MKIPEIIKLAGVVCVAITLFCPLFMILPVLLANDLGLMTKMLGLAVYAITVTTIVLSWKYNHKFLPVISNQPLRRAVGIACYAGCLLWIRFGMFYYPPGGPDPRSLLLPLSVFGSEWIVVAILGSVGHGLEKAAREDNEQYV